jgi:hypothetical protein
MQTNPSLVPRPESSALYIASLPIRNPQIILSNSRPTLNSLAILRIVIYPNIPFITMSPLPTRVFAGVTIPDTPLITKALSYTKAHSTDFAFNHVQRSMLFGFIIASKIPSLADRDLEVHAIGALMHDIGWDQTGELVSKDKRFEVDGADAARNFLRKEAPDWDKHRLQ